MSCYETIVDVHVAMNQCADDCLRSLTVFQCNYISSLCLIPHPSALHFLIFPTHLIHLISLLAPLTVSVLNQETLKCAGHWASRARVEENLMD